MSKKTVYKELDNTRRAEFGFKALKTYCQEVVEDLDNTEVALQDLVADLLHVCDGMGLDFNEIEEKARSHYVSELGDSKPLVKGDLKKTLSKLMKD